MSSELKYSQLELLKDVKFGLLQLQSYIDTEVRYNLQDAFWFSILFSYHPSFTSCVQDYRSIRQSLRSQPIGSLRLTARKVKMYLEPAEVSQFSKVYQKMIDDLDNVDYIASLRIRDASNDSELKKALEAIKLSYNTFLALVEVPLSPTPGPSAN